jgi:hypothetical protein
MLCFQIVLVIVALVTSNVLLGIVILQISKTIVLSNNQRVNLAIVIKLVNLIYAVHLMYACQLIVVSLFLVFLKQYISCALVLDAIMTLTVFQTIAIRFHKTLYVVNLNVQIQLNQNKQVYVMGTLVLATLIAFMRHVIPCITYALSILIINKNVFLTQIALLDSAVQSLMCV